MNNAADAAMQLGDLDRALEEFTVCLGVDDHSWLTTALWTNAAAIWLARGELQQATRHYLGGLIRSDYRLAPYSRALAVEGLAWCATRQGLYTAAAQLLGFASAVRNRIVFARYGLEARLNDQATDTLRAALGEPRLHELSAQGAARDPAAALDTATTLAAEILATDDTAQRPTPSRSADPDNTADRAPTLG